MESLDGMTDELTRVFAAKEQRRKALARLPFPEKVRAVIRLQEMAAPILRARGKDVRPWRVSVADEKAPSASTPTNPGESI
jgi:hypothetical protein